MIIFKTVKYKNLLSSGNIFTEIDLTSNKTTLIVGENGSGKSSLLDALTFVLFNKPFRKINKSQLLNSITNKNLVVELDFEINKTNYRLVRGIKPSIFEIYKNNQLINQSADSKDYQEMLEKQILKINYKSFCQVVVLGSATFLPFMQLSSPQRREIIENLLDLQIFSIMNTLLKDKITSNKDLIKDCENSKNLLEQKITLSQEYLKKIDNNIQKNENNKKILIEEIDLKLSSIENDYNQTQDKIKKIKKKISGEDEYSKKYSEMQKLKNKIENNIDRIDEEINFFNDNDNCPTCKQNIENIFKEKSVEEKQKQISQLKEGLNKIDKSIKKVSEKLIEISSHKNSYNELLLHLNVLKNENSSLLKNKELICKQFDEIDINESIEENKKIIEYKNDLEKIESKYYELLEERNVLNASSILLKDGGIKTQIIKKYVPIINKSINKYLSMFNFYVKFELDEEFNEKIKSRHRDEFSYSSFSEGEKMKINLAILFTWRDIAKIRNSINTNLLIMDEVFDSSLDSNSTEDFMKILSDQDNKTNIVVISHKTEQLNDKFENIIRFKKIKNFSKVLQ